MDKYTARLSNVLIVFIVILTFMSGCTVQQQTMIDDIEQPQTQIEEIESPDDKQQATDYFEVKYRVTPVNLAAPGFEYHNTEASSFIRGAWYDKQHQYLVMNIDGTYSITAVFRNLSGEDLNNRNLMAAFSTLQLRKVTNTRTV